MRAISLLPMLVFAGAALRAADPPPPATVKPQAFLLLPEPRAMRSSISKPLGDARRTVFTPAHATAQGKPAAYTAAEFAKLGVSWETFLERAQKAADERLATLQPELKKDDAGRVIYAVYRGDDELVASLIVAPGLLEIFKNLFSSGIRLVAPDRHSLFVFPAAEGAVEPFAADLSERFLENAFAASDEIFELKSGGAGIRAVGTVRGN